MIKIKTLTLRNFLSVGAVTQTVNFENQNLTLILGENLDLGGDGAKNGTGKTSILQGLSYALFNTPINKIKLDNLINRTNGKGMAVSVDFSVDDVNYRIERGRKPTFLKFFVNDQQVEEESNDSQGDSRETQDAIERVLMMSSDMFRHIIGLNTYNEPFLALKANDQRTIIEQLLGITLLSEKAEAIKLLNRQTKDDIQSEEHRIRAVEEANRRISEQIESLQRRQRLWQTKHDEDLSKLVSEYDELSKVDIAAELAAHRELDSWTARSYKKKQYDSLAGRAVAWSATLTNDIQTMQLKLKELADINIEAELQAHKDLAVYNQRSVELAQIKKDIARLSNELNKEAKTGEKLDSEIATLKDKRCYACGQDFHDHNHESVLDAKIRAFNESCERELKIQDELRAARDSVFELGDKPVTHYLSADDATKQSNQIANLKIQIDSKTSELKDDPYQFAQQLAEFELEDVGKKPITHYAAEAEAIKHSSRVDSLLAQIENKHCEEDPYSEQLEDMSKNALQEVSWDKINQLTRIAQHQEYLLDLLTNKKSFVRKRIIEQNLSYLNSRLTHYLDRLGLPHTVVFQNDLTVDITELGRPLDFDNCSRGERTRIILGLSFAFRDVWESLYSSCNLLFVDELIDNGLDTIGVENSIALLKDMTRRRNKSIFLVSHRDELTSRVGSVLKVIKEHGFTQYEVADDLVT